MYFHDDSALARRFAESRTAPNDRQRYSCPKDCRPQLLPRYRRFENRCPLGPKTIGHREQSTFANWVAFRD
jgi:hypothetical protein